MELTIEQVIECFGRDRVALWIERGMRLDHGMEQHQLDLLLHPDSTWFERRDRLRKAEKVTVRVT